MNKFATSSLLLFCAAAAHARHHGNAVQLQSRALLLTENRGQVSVSPGHQSPKILFTAQRSGTQIMLSAAAIYYTFSKERKAAAGKSKDGCQSPSLRSTHRCSVTLEGANTAPRIRREQKSEYTENYYLPGCPDGITEVPAYGRIVFEQVYPGIDWVVYGKGAGLDYDFVVHPGANPALIKLRIRDADRARIMADGGLSINTSLGAIREALPVSFCEGEKIRTRFSLRGDVVCFATEPYDRTKALIIDPHVEWATYYGGESDDDGLSCATDASGNVFLAGNTLSYTGIAQGGFQDSNISFGGCGFVAKFNSAGKRIWATYYGAYTADARACITDKNGNVYLAGSTSSNTGIAFHGFKDSLNVGNVDAYLVKLDSRGLRKWATYYGGTFSERGTALATDPGANVYLAGSTLSEDGIATQDGFQPYSGGSSGMFGTRYSDAFLVKFDSSGNRLWATYYGGSRSDYAQSCAADRAGNVYLAGTSSSPDLPVSGYQNKPATGSSQSAFLIKYSSNGDRQWATWYGGNGTTSGNSCATDGTGAVYLAGVTNSDSGISTGTAFQSVKGGNNDAFLVKFSSGGTPLWATYFGGTDADDGAGCAVDGGGNAYLIGSTMSSGIASPDAFQPLLNGIQDAYAAAFSSEGTRLWSSYFGGTGSDVARGCAATGYGTVYLCGSTNSLSGLATTGSQQETIGNNFDAFLGRIDVSPQGVTGAITADNTLHVYPNPASTHFNAEVTLPAGCAGRMLHLEIISPAGNIVYKEDRRATAGRMKLAIPLSPAMAAGTYYLRFSAGGMPSVETLLSVLR